MKTQNLKSIFAKSLVAVMAIVGLTVNAQAQDSKMAKTEHKKMMKTEHKKGKMAQDKMAKKDSSSKM